MVMRGVQKTRAITTTSCMLGRLRSTAKTGIILAVVSAKNDYANQIVLKLARTADKKGNRTMGVIPKPDTLLAGSESEAM